MPNHLMVMVRGKIFVYAAGGDTQENVMRRAARIVLREKKKVHCQIINTEKYEVLDIGDAERIMTAELWIEELMDRLSDPLGPEEASQITDDMKMRIINGLKRKRKHLHKHCLNLDREIKEIKIRLNV